MQFALLLKKKEKNWIIFKVDGKNRQCFMVIIRINLLLFVIYLFIMY